MSARARVWMVGVLSTATGAFFLAREESCRDLIGPVVLLALAVVALIAEAWALLLSRKGRPDRRLIDEARPADGVVELVPLLGAESASNPWDRRLGRFVRL